MSDPLADAAALLFTRREQDRRLIAKLEENLRLHPDNPALNYELGRYDGWLAAVAYLEAQVHGVVR